MSGLRDFCLESNRRDWVTWRDWGHLTVASDQGSDMLSALHALEYCDRVRCNVSVFWDAEHGVNRNIWNAIDACGMNALMLLVVLVINLPSMPDESDLRFRQLKDIMGEHYRLATPGTSPIFQHMSNDMHNERRCDEQCQEDETKDQVLWWILAGTPTTGGSRTGVVSLAPTPSSV